MSPGYKPPLAFLEMNSIYFHVLKLNKKPVNEKRISKNTAIARFETFFFLFLF